jgi:CheY-like chemotaxis protein
MASGRTDLSAQVQADLMGDAMQPGSISQITATDDRPIESRPRLGEAGAAVVPLSTAILIVEDSAMIAWTLESFLGQMGFTDIALASNSEEAVAFARSSPPGLIVSDINLGAGADGVDTAVAITEGGRIPVLFVSAYADDAMRQRIAGQLPLASLLAKPILRDSFQAAVRSLLEPPAAQ